MALIQINSIPETVCCSAGKTERKHSVRMRRTIALPQLDHRTSDAFSCFLDGCTGPLIRVEVHV